MEEEPLCWQHAVGYEETEDADQTSCLFIPETSEKMIEAWKGHYFQSATQIYKIFVTRSGNLQRVGHFDDMPMLFDWGGGVLAARDNTTCFNGSRVGPEEANLARMEPNTAG